MSKAYQLSFLFYVLGDRFQLQFLRLMLLLKLKLLYSGHCMHSDLPHLMGPNSELPKLNKVMNGQCNAISPAHACIECMVPRI